MADYVIADLRLFNEEQMKKMNYSSFEEMNNDIIKTWNRSVKPEDTVLIMGDLGNGTHEQTKEVITKLNGKLSWLGDLSKPRPKRPEWKDLGFDFYWGVSLFEEEAEGDIIYLNHKANLSNYSKAEDVLLVVVDSTNPIEGLIGDKVLSADAAKWFYIPLNMDEIMNIYENTKNFEKIENKERRSDIKELEI